MIDFCLYGAITGDIIGSRYVGGKAKDGAYWRSAGLFTKDCTITDCSALALGTKLCLSSGGKLSFAQAYRFIVRMYGDLPYGELFKNWVLLKKQEPYQSWGCGAAFRAVYIADYARSLSEADALAKESAICTHDSEEAVTAAVATVHCAFMARHGYDKRDIKRYARKYYDVDKTLAKRRMSATCRFDCEGVVPLAIKCFLDSENYISCIRNVLSVPCSTSAVASIAGAIAGGYYRSIPGTKDVILDRMPEHLAEIWQEEVTHPRDDNY